VTTVTKFSGTSGTSRVVTTLIVSRLRFLKDSSVIVLKNFSYHQQPTEKGMGWVAIALAGELNFGGI
jgi:hypothetical protein